MSEQGNFSKILKSLICRHGEDAFVREVIQILEERKQRLSGQQDTILSAAGCNNQSIDDFKFSRRVSNCVMNHLREDEDFIEGLRRIYREKKSARSFLIEFKRYGGFGKKSIRDFVLGLEHKLSPETVESLFPGLRSAAEQLTSGLHWDVTP